MASPTSGVNEAQAAAIAELDMFSKGGQVWKRKKKKKTLSNWKQRYFHLKGGRIFYYANVADVKPLGDFDLVITQVKRLDDNVSGSRIKDAASYKYVFQLSTFGSEYHIATESEEELLQWLNMINRVKEHIFSNGLKLNEPARPKVKRSLTGRLGGTLRSRKHTVDPQFNITGGSFNSNAPSSRGGMKGREAVIDEIMTTERDYVSDLTVVKEHFIFKLEDYGLMQKDQKDAIFGNIEELLPLHQQLLEKLEEANKEPDQNLGAVFIDFVCIICCVYCKC